MEDKADKVIGWMAAVLLPILIGVNLYEFGKDAGKREAVQALKCDTFSQFSIIDTKSGKCVVVRGKYRG